MLIRYYIELPVPEEPLAEALVASSQTWIPGLVRKASDRERGLLADVGFGDRLRVTKQVEISLDAPRRLGAALYIPIRWQATGPSGLFPVLDGELELAPLGEHRTTLREHGRLGLHHLSVAKDVLTRSGRPRPLRTPCAPRTPWAGCEVRLRGAKSNPGRFWETRHLFNWISTKATDWFGTTDTTSTAAATPSAAPLQTPAVLPASN